ncbi:putative reverse transcriptase domain-containing protein [Tanacetum coccineum]
MFHITTTPEKSQVKYATCTLLDSALTWWNSHKRTIGTEAAFAMSWGELMKLMTKVYCPRNEIQKMETELWNLTVKNNEFCLHYLEIQELTWECDNCCRHSTRILDYPFKSPNKIDDKKLKGYAVKNAENKRRLNNNYENNHGQQPPAPGHYRKDCPKVKNQNRGDKARVPDARGKAYVLGGGDANPSPNTVTSTFLLNDHHAYMLFDSGADKKVSTSETNIVLRGCTIGLLGHPFNINLMPVDLGSFDVIIGMDWLAKNHAVIVCDEKIDDRRRSDSQDVPTVTGLSRSLALKTYLDIPPIHKVEFPESTLVPRKKNCTPNSQSATFGCRKYNFLVHVIDSEGIHVDPVKIESIKDWESPKTHRNSSIFYVKFDWGEKEETAFQTLKQKLCSALILALPEGSENFVVYCDASHKGLGAVLMQKEKDKTSGILKSFITGVENLIDQRVKVIRCDNGTEFKNKEMNHFCKRKGIKREFSVARTPQQNRVAERKNRTLIEAARTMLADSKLPTTFWAEAVNTAYFVQNKALVTKPHNKTSYELFLGRKPALGFMRPFGCPVKILNTIDH